MPEEIKQVIPKETGMNLLTNADPYIDEKLSKVTIDRICKQIDTYLNQLFASFNSAPVKPVDDWKGIDDITKFANGRLEDVEVLFEDGSIIDYLDENRPFAISVKWRFKTPALLKPLGSEMKDNKIELLNEDIECVNKYLDDINVPKCNSENKPYSIVGRINWLKNDYLRGLSKLESKLLINSVNSVEGETDPYFIRQFDSNKYYWCKCENCEWEDSSEFTEGCHAIADTGDHSDPVCPICGCNKLEGDSDIYPDKQYEGIVEVKIPVALILSAHKKTIDQLNQSLESFRYPSPVNTSLQSGMEEEAIKPEIINKDLYNFLIGNEKPFKLNDVRIMINELLKEEITMSRFTEKLNETVYHYTQQLNPVNLNDDTHSNSLSLLNKFVSEIQGEKLNALIYKHQDNDPNGLTMNQYLSIMSGEQPVMQSMECNVTRLKNGRGESHLLIITDEAVPDIHIGSVIIVPYADGFKDPVKVRIQTDANGKPVRLMKRFAVVLEYIYD